MATHADKVECTKNAKGELLSNDADILVANVREKFHPYFDISERVFVMDAHLAMSHDMKAFRNHLGNLKTHIVKVSSRQHARVCHSAYMGAVALFFSTTNLAGCVCKI